MATAVDTLFHKVESERLARGQLIDLAAGSLGVIRVRNFLPAALCASFMDQLDESLLDGYDAKRYDPPAAHFGPVLNEFNDEDRLGEEYWQQVERAQRFWRAGSGGRDVRTACMRALAEAWEGPVMPATVNRRELYWGMLREVNNGALVHWDEVIREHPRGLFDTRPVAQLAFNLFLSVPERGGEAMVWQRRWRPSDEQYRAGYGYRPEVIDDGTPMVTLTPRAGDGVFFDSRNYHAVQRNDGGRRVAFSFFIGLTGSGSLIIWS